MEIISAKVNWNPNSASPPHMDLLINKLPKLLYEYKDIVVHNEYTRIYYAENNGIVKFLVDEIDKDGNSIPGYGFGGRPFTLQMKDGTVMVAKGPWTGDAFYVHKFGGFPEPCRATYFIDYNTFMFTGGGHLCYITQELAQQLLDKFVPHVKIVGFAPIPTCHIITYQKTGTGCTHPQLLDIGCTCPDCGQKIYDKELL